MTATIWDLPRDRSLDRRVSQEARVPAPRFFRGAMIGTAIGGAMWVAAALAVSSLL